MPKHEVPDDGGNPQIPPSLLAKLQGQQPQTPVYRVNRDGTGELVDADKAHAPTPEQVEGGDLQPLLDGIDKMNRQLQDAIYRTPDIEDEHGGIKAEMFDLSTRLALVHAGNALDYALRRVDDIARTRRIGKLRSELAHEMKAAGLQGDPATGMTPDD